MTTELSQRAHPRLSLGPLLYFWDRARVMRFYEQAASWPVDIVHLGETVCSKRRALSRADWLAIGRDLAAAGKQVVISTLALVEAESELAGVRHCCENGEFLVEANDHAAVAMLEERALPFVAGPTLNVYNHRSYALLRRAGMVRWVMPVELGRDSLLALHAALPVAQRVETEVFAFGHLPLAFSARCFTARAHETAKDACEFVCLNYPGGMPVGTRDGEPFLVVNGIQTQSGRICNLLADCRELSECGVDVLRISPQAAHTGDVVQAFRAALRGDTATTLPAAALAGAPACSGYWHGEAGMR